MTVSPSIQPRARTSFNAPVLVVIGAVIALVAFLLPVNLKSVSPALLRAAGERTPSLGAYGKDLVDVEKIGPAAMVLAAAHTTKDPKAADLETAIEQYANRQPGLMAWGGWDPFLDPLFNIRADAGRKGSVPVLTFIVPQRARDTLRAYLEKSGSMAVQSLVRLRELTKTGRFVPATRPGGQPLDSLILLTALLYQGGHLSAPLQRELRTLVETSLVQKELGDFEPFLVDILSLGRRLDWAQLSELLRRTNSTKTVSEYAHLSRVAPDQLPLIYAAALFSDSADRVATYLIEFGKQGLEDLTLALSHGQGAVRQLLFRQVPVNRTSTPALSAGAELALMHPQLLLALKYLGVVFGLWMLLRGLDRWLVSPEGVYSLPQGVGGMKAGALAILFSLLLMAVTEPFLLRAAPLSEYQLRLPVLVISNAPVPADTKPIINMDPSSLISIAFFAALQVAVYLICLLKIRQIDRQPLPALVKLRLMENEENLFDMGLYVGIGGTAAAMVMVTLGLVEANLLAAFSSNLFGITCVAFVKIRHVRPYKTRLILEGQIAASPIREPNEPSVASARGSAAL